MTLMCTAMACSRTNTTVSDAGTDSTSSGFASSDCGGCVAQVCADAIASCAAQPDCAAYIECLNACPIGDDGNVDPSCEQACPRTSSTQGSKAAQQLTACRANGPGVQCSACGGGGSSLLLHQKCTPSTDTNACHKCGDEHCCDSRADCHADPDCGAYQNCLVACSNGTTVDGGPIDAGSDAGSFTCEAYCYAQHPRGLNEWAPLLTCVDVYCADPCGGQPGACQKCTTAHCTDLWTALYGTPQGYLLFACTAKCPQVTPDCAGACEKQYPQAKAAYDAWLSCALNNCASSCG